MADFSHEVDVVVDDENRCRIVIDGKEQAGRVSVTIKRRDATGDFAEVAKIAWVIDWENRAIRHEPAALATGAQLNCLANCLIGMVGPIVDCLMKAKSKKDVWKCIEDHAVGTVFGGVSCVLQCF